MEAGRWGQLRHSIDPPQIPRAPVSKSWTFWNCTWRSSSATRPQRKSESFECNVCTSARLPGPWKMWFRNQEMWKRERYLFHSLWTTFWGFLPLNFCECLYIYERGLDWYNPTYVWPFATPLNFEGICLVVSDDVVSKNGKGSCFAAADTSLSRISHTNPDGIDTENAGLKEVRFRMSLRCNAEQFSLWTNGWWNFYAHLQRSERHKRRTQLQFVESMHFPSLYLEWWILCKNSEEWDW